MDEDRYARYGGFRRYDSDPFFAQFGFGGSGYGGFGRKGKYGGYRSHYDYSHPHAMRHVYSAPSEYTVNMNSFVPPTWHKPTFIFAAFVITMLILGLWFGKQNNSYYSFSYY